MKILGIKKGSIKKCFLFYLILAYIINHKGQVIHLLHLQVHFEKLPYRTL